MLCEKCHSRPACVHIRAYGPDGQSQDHNLCLQCAMTSMTDQADLSRFLQILEENAKDGGAKLPISMEELKRLADMARRNEPEKRCPECGRTLSQLLKSQSLGCLKCLEAFREDIRGFLREPLAAQRRHKAASTGLLHPTEPSYDQERLAELREDLARAVQAEQYEKAAMLQEQIHALGQDIAATLQPSEDTAFQTYKQLCDEFRNRPRADYAVNDAELPVWAPTHLTSPTIRLASIVRYNRNLKDYPLPPYQGATLTDATDVADRLLKILQQDPLFADATVIQPGQCREAEQQQLVSRRYVAPSFLNRPYPVYLLHSANRRIIARINGEDHLQVELWSEPGEAYRSVQLLLQFDARLRRQVTLATDAEFGVLTRKLPSLGSGMVIGELLHLPAMALESRQDTVANACHELHLFFKSFYSQNFPQSAGLYFIRTEFAMGETLNRRCRMVARGAAILERHELAARSARHNVPDLRLFLLDRLGRAAGTIKGARFVEPEEARYLLSMLWLGAEMGVFPEVNWGLLFRDYARLPVHPTEDKQDRHSQQLASITARMLRHDFGHEEDLE